MVDFRLRTILYLTYEGEVQLGIDLTKADIAVRGDTIAITLPPVEVLSNAIDEKSIEVYNESKNVFNPISVNDYKELRSSKKKPSTKSWRKRTFTKSPRKTRSNPSPSF